MKALNLFSLNGISNEIADLIIYNAILRGVFEEICKEIKRTESYKFEKTTLRNSIDPMHSTRIILKKYVGCELGDEEISTLYKWLSAFFKKRNQRTRVNPDIRNSLLRKQEWKCAICESSISLTSSHYDHIIPWDFVGDELENNYQMLCPSCNVRKGVSSYFEFSMALKKR